MSRCPCWDSSDSGFSVENTWTMNFYKKLTGTNFKVTGTVVESYEPVRKEFEQFFRDGQESRAQLCVYVNSEKVIGEENV